MKSSPQTAATRRSWLSRPTAAGSANTVRPLLLSSISTSNRASARLRSTASTWPSSVFSAFWNLRRAGVLKNKSRTSTVVPWRARPVAERRPRRRCRRFATRARRRQRATSTSIARPMRCSAGLRRESPSRRDLRDRRASRSCSSRGATMRARARRARRLHRRPSRGSKRRRRPRRRRRYGARRRRASSRRAL